MVLNILLIIVGLAILIFGGDLLVRGATSLSKKFGIPSIVIGLTIVSFGTSAPELIVNLLASFKGASDLALGNVVGSNIANILLILGITAFLTTLKVQKNTTWKEIPFALLAALVLFFMANDIYFDQAAVNEISRIDGLVLIAFFIIFMYYTFNLSKQNQNTEINDKIKVYSNPIAFLYLILGVLGLFLGGQLLTDNAIALAQIAGLSEMLIGVTIVAIGTSLPEMATSIIAARKGQVDLAVGNVVGSNIFNILWILGLSSIITPLSINPNIHIDLMVVALATIFLFIGIFIDKKHQLSKIEGSLFLMGYVAYTAFIIYRG